MKSARHSSHSICFKAYVGESIEDFPYLKLNITTLDVRFVVLTVLSIKIMIFWDVMLHSLVVNGHLFTEPMYHSMWHHIAKDRDLDGI